MKLLSLIVVLWICNYGFSDIKKSIRAVIPQTFTVFSEEKVTCDYEQISSSVSSNFFFFQVPRVFVGGKCIGGGTETKQLHKEGKLLDMVKRCQGT